MLLKEKKAEFIFLLKQLLKKEAPSEFLKHWDGSVVVGNNGRGMTFHINPNATPYLSTELKQKADALFDKFFMISQVK